MIDIMLLNAHPLNDWDVPASAFGALLAPDAW